MIAGNNNAPRTRNFWLKEPSRASPRTKAHAKTLLASSKEAATAAPNKEEDRGQEKGKTRRETESPEMHYKGRRYTLPPPPLGSRPRQLQLMELVAKESRRDSISSSAPCLGRGRGRG